MTLDQTTLRALDRLLDDGLDLAPADREAWIAGLSDDDARHGPVLRELLLSPVAGQTADWLDRPLAVLSPADDAGAATAGAELVAGDRVGPWTLRRPLGEGGMGSVWLAERSDGLLSRPVALKLPHFGARPRAIAERFAREREILSTLAHPNIARLYDAGIDPGGQPWLAMEYVEGRPITEWADQRRLAVDARVALFLPVLRAVQHAHANLVVHRDLKPSNILVTGSGDARLLDFGIAKLLSDGEARESELTRISGRALTPAYASPEQIAGAPISTASDVYSLGVVLFELLTGQRPYRSAADDRALERAIVEDEPRRASSAVDDAAARARGASSARRLARSLAGDLDTILAKALAKRPDRRYPTVAALAADLERHLAGEPIEARGVRAGYRAMRFVVRHRVAAGATGAIVVALLSGAMVALWQAAEAKREAARAGAVQSFLIDLFRTNTADQSDPLRARNTTARELLDRGADRLATAFADEPAAKEAIAEALAELYLDLGLPGEASEAAEQRLAAARRIYRPQDRRLALAVVDAAYALVLREAIPIARTRALIDEARARIERDPPDVLAAELEYVASRFAAETADAGAIDAARRAVAIFRVASPQDARLVRALDWLAVLESRSGGSDAAIRAIAEALALARRLDLPPSRLLRLILRAGEQHSLRDEVDDADRLLGEAHAMSLRVNGPRHPMTLTTRRMLMRHLAETGRIAEAEGLAEGLVDDMIAAGGNREPPLVQETRRIVVAFLLLRGRLADAERELAAAEAAWGPDPVPSFELADHRIARARAFTTRGRLDEARRELDAAGQIVTRLGYPEHSMLAMNVLLGRVAVEIAAAENANNDGTLDPALERARAASRSPSTRIGLDTAMAELATARGRAADGVTLAGRAIAALDVPQRSTLVDEDARAHYALAVALGASGRCLEALAPFARARELYGRLHAPGSPWLGEIDARESVCLRQAGRPGEADERLAAARSIYAAAGPLNVSMTRALARAGSPRDLRAPQR